MVDSNNIDCGTILVCCCHGIIYSTVVTHPTVPYLICKLVLGSKATKDIRTLCVLHCIPSRACQPIILVMLCSYVANSSNEIWYIMSHATSSNPISVCGCVHSYDFIVTFSYVAMSIIFSIRSCYQSICGMHPH